MTRADLLVHERKTWANPGEPTFEEILMTIRHILAPLEAPDGRKEDGDLDLSRAVEFVDADGTIYPARILAHGIKNPHPIVALVAAPGGGEAEKSFRTDGRAGLAGQFCLRNLRPMAEES